MIDISGLDKVDLLAQLWQTSRPADSYLSSFLRPPSFDKERAKIAVNSGSIDYFCGRCIRADLREDYVNPLRYDCDAGQGVFEKIVQQMRTQ